MVKNNMWMRILLAAGLLWFLLGVAWSPSNKIYQQGLVALLWLPMLLLMFSYKDLLRDLWRTHRVECSALLGLFGWAALSLLWSDALEPARELKRLFYIILFLFSLQIVADTKLDLMMLLQVAGVGLGVAALVSIGMFYMLEDHSWYARLQGIGQISHPILGGYVVGAAAIWLLHLLPGNFWWRIICLFAVGCSMAFVVLTQSRGAFVALAVTILVMPLWRPGRVAYGATLVVLVAVLIGFLLFEPIIMSRGTSYRPEILLSSIFRIADAPFGLGLGSDYRIFIDTGQSFDHTHNLILHLGIQLGWLALACWAVLWFGTLRLAWRARHSDIGQAVLALWVFSSIAMQLDAASLLSKPRAEWFITWLPIGLALILPKLVGRQTNLRKP